MSRFVVVDLEMCNVSKDSHKHLRSELIQIGAAALDDELKITDTFMTFVRPVYGTIDKRIRKLTGISNEDVKNAPEVKEALEMFLSWLPEDAVLVSWSTNDEHQIREETKCKKICIPLFSKLFDGWIDCQKTFSEIIRSDRCYRLSEALAISGVEYDEKFHDALADAKNTALLFRKMQTEEEFTFSVYYMKEEENQHLTYNPFKDLFANFTTANQSA